MISKASARGRSSRPRSLGEVVVLGKEFGDRDAFPREFLDEFYSEADAGRRAAMLAEEPPIDDDARANAYYAAAAEHLALKFHLPVPAWTGEPERFLKHPFFPSGLESLKATLLVESPSAFRRRMIFVDADPLYRPRRDTPRFGEWVAYKSTSRTGIAARGGSTSMSRRGETCIAAIRASPLAGLRVTFRPYRQAREDRAPRRRQ